MDLGILKNLELLPEILAIQKANADRLAKFLPPLTSKKEVAKFLGVTPRTINNYIEQGFLVDGVHFHRKNDKILVFIEDAILEFRDNRDKGLIDEKVAV